MSSTPEPGTVFEPAWEDNPTWDGSELYEDLAVAQVFAADAYVSEMYPVLDEHDEGPGDLVWTEKDGSWELTDSGKATPVSIDRRTVRVRPAPAGALPLVQQLALATEFRVPLPQGKAGGYGEVVVQRDDVGVLWAVTDGAFSGLRAWVDGEGWRHISDVGRAVAYRTPGTRRCSWPTRSPNSRPPAIRRRSPRPAPTLTPPALSRSELSRTWEWPGPLSDRATPMCG